MTLVLLTGWWTPQIGSWHRASWTSTPTFDAQAFWDPTLSPSPLHGVTTVFGGNCGFTIAALDSSAADYLMQMLAIVEGMPLEALSRPASRGTGRPRPSTSTAWRAAWPSTPDSWSGHRPSAGWSWGGGHRAPATPDGARRHASAAHRRPEAGGIGFSSSRAANHNDANGDPVPSRYAIGTSWWPWPRRAGGRGHVPRVHPDPVERLRARPHIAIAGRDVGPAGRPLNWNVLASPPRPEAEVEERAAGLGRRRWSRGPGS